MVFVGYMEVGVREMRVNIVVFLLYFFFRGVWIYLFRVIFLWCRGWVFLVVYIESLVFIF